MRAIVVVLAALLVLIQYPLWLGKGGWLRVWDLDRQLQAQLALNAEQKIRNLALAGEVRDLQQGLAAIEERARYELGMIKPDEIFVQTGEPVPPVIAATEPPPYQPGAIRRAAHPLPALSGARSNPGPKPR